MTEVTLERITWLDHAIEVGQLSIKDAKRKCKLVKRVSVGWVIGQDHETILLAHTRDGKNDYADVTILGTALVLKREVIG